MKKKLLLLLFTSIFSMSSVAQRTTVQRMRVYKHWYSYDDNGNIISRSFENGLVSDKAILIDSLQVAGAKVRIYPNPTTGVVNISGANPLGKNVVTYSLYGAGSQLIATKRTGETTVRFDLTGLPNGIYLLKVGSDDGSTWKIIKR